MIIIDSLAFIFLALSLLTVPLNWLLPCLTAACIHEMGHISAILLSRGTICHVHIRIGGAVIYADIGDPIQELLCILAGPIASLFLTLFFAYFPQLAVCGMVQGIFNLLPFKFLDGGRILFSLVQRRYPQKADTVFRFIQCLLLTIGAIAVYFLSLS